MADIWWVGGGMGIEAEGGFGVCRGGLLSCCTRRTKRDRRRAQWLGRRRRVAANKLTKRE